MFRKLEQRLFNTLDESRKYELWERGLNDQSIYTIELFEQFRSNKPLPWRVVPATAVKILWNSFADTGTVLDRHHKMLYKIVDQVCENIMKLWVLTYLCGHTTDNPDSEFEEAGFTEDEKERFYDWVERGFISDYGFPLLNELWLELNASQDPVHLLVNVDRVFNVWHGQGPLADKFIEGGTWTLDELKHSAVA